MKRTHLDRSATAPVGKLKKSLVQCGVFVALLAFSAASADAQVGLMFEGTSQYDNNALAGGNNFIPPDTMGAIGTTQYMEFTNGSVSVFDRTNGALQSRVTMGNFWSSVGQAPANNGDQRVLFDLHTNRWIAVGFSASTSNLNIAVSDTANALGSWKSTMLTGFTGAAPAPTGFTVIGGIADYPTLGIDSNGVYIGTNNFNSLKRNSDGATGFSSFAGTNLFSIPKSDLFGGAPTTANMTTFNSTNASPDNGFAIQAAVNWGASAGNTASVLADGRTVNNNVFYQINGVNAAGATQTASINVAGSGYTAGPPDGRQPDGSRIIDTLDTRISANVMQANGKLYSVQTIDVSGASALRWMVNDATTGSLIGSGLIADTLYDYYQGSIAVNEFGQVVIGYNRSGAQTADLNGDGFADGNISFMARAYESLNTGLLNQMAEYLLKVSPISDYHNGSVFGQPAAGRQRWGDFSTVTLDPLNHNSFWAIGQFAREWNNTASGHPGGTGGSRWGTWIAEINTPSVPEAVSTLTLLSGVLALLAIARRRMIKN